MVFIDSNWIQAGDTPTGLCPEQLPFRNPSVSGSERRFLFRVYLRGSIRYAIDIPIIPELVIRLFSTRVNPEFHRLPLGDYYRRCICKSEKSIAVLVLQQFGVVVICRSPCVGNATIDNEVLTCHPFTLLRKEEHTEVADVLGFVDSVRCLSASRHRLWSVLNSHPPIHQRTLPIWAYRSHQGE